MTLYDKVKQAGERWGYPLYYYIDGNYRGLCCGIVEHERRFDLIWEDSVYSDDKGRFATSFTYEYEAGDRHQYVSKHKHKVIEL